MTLRTIIVDDEPLARKLMRATLAENSEVEIIAECKNGREALAAVQDLSPDLMLLDIQMPGGSGFDVIKSLHSRQFDQKYKFVDKFLNGKKIKYPGIQYN